jgi:hypothetical protein
MRWLLSWVWMQNDGNDGLSQVYRELRLMFSVTGKMPGTVKNIQNQSISVPVHRQVGILPHKRTVRFAGFTINIRNGLLDTRHLENADGTDATL